MQTILNLTRHLATDEQAATGLVNLRPDIISKIHELSIFQPVPTDDILYERAYAIVAILKDNGFSNECVMLGGAPYFIAILDTVITAAGFKPCYPFTLKVSNGPRQKPK